MYIELRSYVSCKNETGIGIRVDSAPPASLCWIYTNISMWGSHNYIRALAIYTEGRKLCADRRMLALRKAAAVIK